MTETIKYTAVAVSFESWGRAWLVNRWAQDCRSGTAGTCSNLKSSLSDTHFRRRTFCDATFFHPIFTQQTTLLLSRCTRTYKPRVPHLVDGRGVAVGRQDCAVRRDMMLRKIKSLPEMGVLSLRKIIDTNKADWCWRDKQTEHLTSPYTMMFPQEIGPKTSTLPFPIPPCLYSPEN